MIKKPVMDAPSETKSKPKTRLAVIILLVAILTVLVAGIVVLAVHIIMEHPRSQNDVCHATYHQSGKMIERQEVTMTNTEVEFASDNYTVIFDYATGLSTYKFGSNTVGMKDCYVLSFNMTMNPTLQTLRELYKATNTDIQIQSEVVKHFEVTDVWLNDIALGERSKNACRGKHIYFFREVTDGVRKKRGGFISGCFDIGSVAICFTIEW